VSEEDFARETITQDPEDFMADIGLEAIEGQDDTAVGFGEALEALGILEREGEEFIVTI
jgi:hypothetical protein